MDDVERRRINSHFAVSSVFTIIITTDIDSGNDGGTMSTTAIIAEQNYPSEVQHYQALLLKTQQLLIN